MCAILLTSLALILIHCRNKLSIAKISTLCIELYNFFFFVFHLQTYLQVSTKYGLDLHQQLVGKFNFGEKHSNITTILHETQTELIFVSQK